jgi:uncharacterized protein with HEPN domain
VRDDRERLLDILDAIERIERRATAGGAAFQSDELLQVWIVHHLEIIGEACRGLSQDFRQLHQEYDWLDPVRMRNVLSHQYFEIDLDAVWSAVEQDLPELKLVVENALGVGT